MLRNKIIIAVVVIAAIAGGFWFQRKSAAAKQTQADAAAIETAKVDRKDLAVTVSASGALEALTTVEVKSRGGGEIKRLFVDAGDTVKVGQLIAQIDPTQVRSKADQASAQVTSARAQAVASRLNAALQEVQTSSDIGKSTAALEAAKANVAQISEQLRQDQETTESNVREAQAGLASAKARLAQAQAQRQAQPELQDASLVSAKAGVEAARQNLAKVRSGARPQELAQSEASLRNAEAAVHNAESTLSRQKNLLDKGFVSRQAVDDAQKTYDQSVAQRDSAAQALAMLREGNRAEDVAQAQAQLQEAEANLRVATANQVQVALKDKDVEAADQAVKQAEAGLTNAQAQRRNIVVRQKQLEAARASVRQAEMTLNASRGNKLQDQAKRQQVQVALADLRRQTLSLNEAMNDLAYTNVYAPRNGVIMEKLAEEGSVIPPGTAALKEGAGLVTLADTSRMFVLANVDETDMAGIRVGQATEITVAVLPDQKFKGRVVKIFPLGKSDQNVIRFPVRIQIDNPSAALRPGMTADVTITVANEKNVLVVPDVAITRNKGKATVQVLVNGEQQEREVVAGLSNWDDTEIKSGLKEGEEVVIPPPPGSDNPFGGPGKGGGPGANKKDDTDRTKRRMMMSIRQRQGG